MIRVYHNATCSKSKAVLEGLHAAGIPFEMVEYLHNPPTAQELKDIYDRMQNTTLQQLNRNPDYKVEEHTEQEVFKYLAENPAHLQRPILVTDSHAAIVRTADDIQAFLRIIS